MALRAVVEMQVVGEFTSPDPCSETASPAVREEAERRKQAITGARNVLREGLRNAPLL